MEHPLTCSATEAAQRLGLGVALVRRLLRAGRIPSVRVGRRPNYRVPVALLEEILRNPEGLSEEREEARRRFGQRRGLASRERGTEATR